MKKFLADSLIYQMSLGSKELFHSNVWAWLMEKEPRMINIFFNQDLSGYEIKVKREFKNRDIVITASKNLKEQFCLVIENKIKTLPTLEQLQRYTESNLDSIVVEAVYTGLINPFSDLPTFKTTQGTYLCWRFVDFKEIVEKIAIITLQSNQFSPLQKQEILEYCQTVQAIRGLLMEQLEKHTHHLSFETIESLQAVRFDDIFIKMKGADFMHYFQTRKNEIATRIGDFELYTNQSFNNGKATLDFRYSNHKTQAIYPLDIGIQIEGTQYRIVACTYLRNNLKKSCAEIYGSFSQNGWFDKEFSHTKGTIFNKKTSMKGRNNSQFNKYETTEYSFVYQYYDLDESNHSYEQLFDSIKADLQKAATLLQ